MSRLRPLLVLAVLLALTLGAQAQLAVFKTSSLTIDTASGPRRFAIELALTPAQQEQGLMFRRDLAPDAGMLFDLGSERIATSG